MTGDQGSFGCASGRPQTGRLGLIAGNGRFPLLLAEEARRQGMEVTAVAHQGETLPELAERVAQITWVRVGQLERVIRTFKDAQIRHVVMAGGIRKTRLFHTRPDLRAIRLLLHVRERRDDLLLRAVARELEREGIEVQDAMCYLGGLLAPEGDIVGPSLSRREREDLALGWKIAKQIGGLDLGQCVVVKSGVVVAIETCEGTDRTIERGGELGGPGGVVVKVCKPGQDLRFDLPTVGPETIRTMARLGARVLAVEGGRTLLLDREELLSQAKAHGITVVGVKE